MLDVTRATLKPQVKLAFKKGASPFSMSPIWLFVDLWKKLYCTVIFKKSNFYLSEVK